MASAAMKSVVVDKVASVTQACALGRSCASRATFPAEEGVVIVAEVLNNKSTYNTLELASGRMAKVVKGDIVVGALGPRRALFGYSGHVPSALKPGDVIQMLNIGGVMGVCDSATADKGKPFDCRVLGVVLQFPVSRRAHRRPGARRLPRARFRAPRSIPAAYRWWRWPAPAWKPARPRPPRRSSPHAPSRTDRSMPSRPPAYRCAGTSWRSRMPARAAR